MAANETIGVLDDAAPTGNATSPSLDATWLCGTAGPLWNHSLSWDTQDRSPGEKQSKSGHPEKKD
jgi:hypothetical protein